MSTLTRPGTFLLPLIAGLLLAACSKPAPAPEPLRSVKVITLGESPLGTGLEFSGEVRARSESRLGFRVAGKLLQRQADLGQAVKAGQLLAQLDPQDYQLAQDAARAQVAAAQTQRDLAAADLKRFQALRDQNFISSAELERRDTTLKAAQAQLEQAQAQLASQGNQAAYTRLTAPAAGVVTAVEAEPGQVLAAGTPVLRLALEGPRDVVFAVPEDRVAAMRVGAAVRIKPWGEDKALAGPGARDCRQRRSGDPHLHRQTGVGRTFGASFGPHGHGQPVACRRYATSGHQIAHHGLASGTGQDLGLGVRPGQARGAGARSGGGHCG